MRLYRCVAAVATACNFAHTFAIPVESSPAETALDKREPATAGDRLHRLNLEWRDPSGASNTKYFRKLK
jgi:hypothetical protein